MTPQDLTEMLPNIPGLSPDILTKLLLSVFMLVLVLVARRLAMRVILGRISDPRMRYQWSKTSGYIAFVVAVLLIGQIWLEAIQGMGTFLGLLTAGLAIALRDLVTNMAGWAFILLRHPFMVGDRIQIGEHRGDVVDVRLFQFTLLEIGNWVSADQSTGRIIHVPNSRVFSEPISNYTAEFEYLWHELPILVTFESNWKKAKEIIQKTGDDYVGHLCEDAERAIQRSTRKLLIFYGKLTPKVYTDVRDSGVMLTLRFMCPVRGRRGYSEGIWETILDAFEKESDIDFAYPTQRVYANFLEGKEGARAEVPLPVRGPDGA